MCRCRSTLNSFPKVEECLINPHAQQAWGGWQTKKLAKFLCKSHTGCVPTDQVEDLKACGLWLVFETTESHLNWEIGVRVDVGAEAVHIVGAMSLLGNPFVLLRTGRRRGSSLRMACKN